MTGEFAAQLGLSVLAPFAAYCQMPGQRGRLSSRKLSLVVALAASGLYALLIMSGGGGIYGVTRHAVVFIGVALSWITVLTHDKDTRAEWVLTGIEALSLIGCWLPAASAEAPDLTGSLFIMAQITTGLAASFWLYATVQRQIESANGALLLQVAGIALLGLGSLNRFGRAFSWDPLEAWWLFSVCTSLVVYILSRRRPAAWLLTLGLIPALFTWLASWQVVQVLQAASILAAR